MKQSIVHFTFCFLSYVPSRFTSKNEHIVPTDNANIVLKYAVFANNMLDFKAGFRVFSTDENNEVDAFVDGHKMNVPIRPPYRLIVYPL